MSSEAIASPKQAARTSKSFELSNDAQVVIAGTLDSATIVSLSLIAGLLYHTLAKVPISDYRALFGTGIATMALFIPLAAARGAYAPESLRAPATHVRAILFAWCYAIFTLVGFAFIAKVSDSFS